MTWPDKHYFDLLLAMTGKEIKTRYKKAIFGFLWMIIQPVSQMIIIGAVVHLITQVPLKEYLPFLLTGLLPWAFFSMTLTKTTPAYIQERQIVQKSAFPLEVIIFSIILANALHFIIALGLFLLVLVFIGAIEWQGLWLLPLGLGWLIILAAGFSMLASALNVKYRDVGFVVTAGLPIWFYATPILYNLNLLPKFIEPWLYANPMTGITELFRISLLATTPSNISHLLTSFGVSLIMLVLGWLVFKKESPYFVDYV
jgi:ABC-type polysaccharide/polyol phosphate export permease